MEPQAAQLIEARADSVGQQGEWRGSIDVGIARPAAAAAPETAASLPVEAPNATADVEAHALHKAVWDDDMPRLNKLLKVVSPTGLEALDPQQSTPLQLAIRLRHLAAASALVAAGADGGARDSAGSQAMLEVARLRFQGSAAADMQRAEAERVQRRPETARPSQRDPAAYLAPEAALRSRDSTARGCRGAASQREVATGHRPCAQAPPPRRPAGRAPRRYGACDAAQGVGAVGGAMAGAAADAGGVARL